MGGGGGRGGWLEVEQEEEEEGAGRIQRLTPPLHNQHPSSSSFARLAAGGKKKNKTLVADAAKMIMPEGTTQETAELAAVAVNAVSDGVHYVVQPLSDCFFIVAEKGGRPMSPETAGAVLKAMEDFISGA
jgi:hypothetical protein